jgi:hypothetical protein
MNDSNQYKHEIASINSYKMDAHRRIAVKAPNEVYKYGKLILNLLIQWYCTAHRFGNEDSYMMTKKQANYECERPQNIDEELQFILENFEITPNLSEQVWLIRI